MFADVSAFLGVHDNQSVSILLSCKSDNADPARGYSLRGEPLGCFQHILK
jgi:hypothetical protein